MNWYEWASADEVKEVLTNLLRTYDFVTVGYARESEYGDPVRIEHFPLNGFEMAEALWGEYGEELF